LNPKFSILWLMLASATLGACRTETADTADSPSATLASAAAATSLGGEAGLAFYPLATPLRLLDTRPGRSGTYAPGAPLQSEVLYRYSAPAGQIPSTANALVVSVSLSNYVTTWMEYDRVWRDTWSWTAADTDYRLYPRVELFSSATWQPQSQEYLRVGSGPLRPTAQVVTVPLDGTRTFSLRPARNPLYLAGNPEEQSNVPGMPSGRA
jgi:hypothetical protein